MKEVLGLVAVVLGGLSAFLGFIGGVVLLNTWAIAFVVLFVVKILIVVGVFTVALSWWTVILTPIGMFLGGLLCLGLALVVGTIIASIAK